MAFHRAHRERVFEDAGMTANSAYRAALEELYGWAGGAIGAWADNAEVNTNPSDDDYRLARVFYRIRRVTAKVLKRTEAVHV